MKILLAFIILLLPLRILAQDADHSFHTAANLYIDEKNKEARATVDDALRRYPNDPKLIALRNKMKDDKKKEDEQKKDQKKDEQNKDQKDKQDQKDKKDQDKQDKQQQDKKDQEKKDQEKKDQKKQQGDQKKDEKDKDKKEIPPSVSDKLKEMQMSEEKAKMILEAMKHQEIQYLQQNKRKATKPKDKSKPDW